MQDARSETSTLPAVQVTAGSVRGRARHLRTKFFESAFIWPLMVLLGAIVLVPTVDAIIHSFTNWQPGYSSPFVGFRNYTDVLTSTLVHTIAQNEVVFMIGVPLWAGAPLAIALLLHEGVPASGVFRTIMFFPSILSPVILGILFNALLRPDGLLNATLKSVGLGGLAHAWIDDPHLVKPVIILVIMWYTMGFGVLLYGAALSAVPLELFEAAEMDGASWSAKLRYVMLPAILPMVVLNTVFSFGSVFLLFGYIYVLTQGGPGYSSTTLDYDVFQNAMVYGKFGVAAAEAVVLLGIVLAILVLAARLGSRFQGGVR